MSADRCAQTDCFVSRVQYFEARRFIYSYLNASTGARFAARLAGINPDNKPIAIEKKSAKNKVSIFIAAGTPN